MSRLGKIPITIPSGVNISVDGPSIKVEGPNGMLSMKLKKGIKIEQKDGQLLVLSEKKNKSFNKFHGTARANIANMVIGVSDGWSKELELVGTGYRAEISGNKLILTIGYSHPVNVEAPEGISFKVEKNIVTVSGNDKSLVGKIADIIRSARPPEPYKGKGIKYRDEVIRKKAGKAAKAAEGAI